MKKLALACVVLSSFALTGCLEELLASLCKRLASNDSVIVVFQTENVSAYDDLKAKITIVKSSEGAEPEQAYHASECDGVFSFPSGHRKNVTDGISLSLVLNDTAREVLANGDDGNLDGSSVYKVTVEWLDDCAPDSIVAIEAHTETKLEWASALDGSSLPEELQNIEECQITGQAALVTVFETLPEI